MAIVVLPIMNNEIIQAAHLKEHPTKISGIGMLATKKGNYSLV